MFYAGLGAPALALAPALSLALAPARLAFSSPGLDKASLLFPAEIVQCRILLSPCPGSS